VELDWSGPQPDGSCTCPHAADGHFCKHLVAVIVTMSLSPVPA
jgi:uncharacterized Zn finger protein